MTERNYFFIVGLTTLPLLYFNFAIGIYLLTSVLLLESITNVRIPIVLQKVKNQNLSPDMKVPILNARFSLSASRVWHIVYAMTVLCSYIAINTYELNIIWFVPWFMSIAALSAAVTNLCPVYAFLVYLGFSHK